MSNEQYEIRLHQQLAAIYTLLKQIAENTEQDDADDYNYAMLDMSEIDEYRRKGWKVFKFDDRQSVYMRRGRLRDVINANTRNPQGTWVHSPDDKPDTKPPFDKTRCKCAEVPIDLRDPDGVNCEYCLAYHFGTVPPMLDSDA